MPRGALWEFGCAEEFDGFWYAVADCLQELNNNACKYSDNLNPCHGQELERLAQIWGYPIDCIGYPESIDQLCEFLGIINGPCTPGSLGFLREIISFAGYEDGVSVTEKSDLENNEYFCKNNTVGCIVAGKPFSEWVLYDPLVEEFECVDNTVGCVEAGMPFSQIKRKPKKTYLCVSIDQDVELEATGVGGCCLTACDPLCRLRLPALECLLDRYTPAHITIIYEYQ